MYWKNTGICTAAYFAFIWDVLKQILLQLEKEINSADSKTETLIEMFNEVLDVKKEVNEVFNNMILVTFINSFVAVFHHLLHFIFNTNATIWIHMYRLIAVIWYSLPFLTICLCSSCVIRSGNNFKYSLEKCRKEELMIIQSSAIFNQHSFTFTILDSIIIDKSLILSAGGALLSYGILMATFSGC